MKPSGFQIHVLISKATLRSMDDSRVEGCSDSERLDADVRFRASCKAEQAWRMIAGSLYLADRRRGVVGALFVDALVEAGSGSNRTLERA